MMVLDSYHAGCLLSEVFVWRDCYIPRDGSEGKTVLSVGAGWGEDVPFFLEHGAVKVICVESDPTAIEYLRKNIADNGWNPEVHGEPFNLSHLSIPHDFLKKDIEGGEEVLLDYEGKLGPCRIEVHFVLIGERADALIRKHNLTEIRPKSGLTVPIVAHRLDRTHRFGSISHPVSSIKLDSGCRFHPTLGGG